jgi:uncharacterized protein (DUF488 family)
MARRITYEIGFGFDNDPAAGSVRCLPEQPVPKQSRRDKPGGGQEKMAGQRFILWHSSAMSAERKTIWTIGHSTRKIEEFLGLLKAHDITALADVRRYPGSRRHPQFGQEQLAKESERQGISYVHFPELGGRRPARPDSPNTAWRNEAFRGYADYMMTPEFKAGIERLRGLAEQKATAIMCAEALWWQCHRGLIADFLKADGQRVLHILAPKKAEEHPFTSAARLVNGRLSYADLIPDA